jgi:hypothetical protein
MAPIFAASKDDFMSYERPTHKELAQDLLVQMMGDISEDCWFAEWMHDLEFILWDAMTTGKMSFGWGMVKERDLIRMKHLHEVAGGWWIWAEGEENRRFVTTEEWLTILVKRAAR